MDPAGLLDAGIHEFIFSVEAYQTQFGTPGLYDAIAGRFRVAQNGGYYHIPLVLSPFGYSTYRGR